MKNKLTLLTAGLMALVIVGCAQLQPIASNPATEQLVADALISQADMSPAQATETAQLLQTEASSGGTNLLSLSTLTSTLAASGADPTVIGYATEFASDISTNGTVNTQSLEQTALGIGLSAATASLTNAPPVTYTPAQIKAAFAKAKATAKAKKTPVTVSTNAP